MTQIPFDGQAIFARPMNDNDGNVSCSQAGAGRPCVVLLESGIQALVEITGFTYVEGVPVAIAGPLAEDVDPGELLERGPDGVRLKRV